MLVYIAIAAVIVGVTITALLWHGQERIVFQPPGPPHPEARGVRRIDTQAEDGQPLFAYLVGEPTSAGVVLVFHGNADLAAWQIPWATELARRSGRAVLVTEFRGYAGLPGAPTYPGSRLDARAVYAIARDSLGVPPGKVALYGHSLGSAIATELASEVDSEVLLLVAPMTSVRDMAYRVSPTAILLFWTGLARVHYDTETLVRSLDAPVWVAHGSNDAVIPVEMGRRVFAAAKVKGELLLVDAAGHNDLVDHAGEGYWHWLIAALR
jgi:pimeloyl-ACP methyl ester carboxylesterase